MERSIELTTQERRELERRTRSRKLRVEDVRRARLILMLAAGESYMSVRTAMSCDAGYVSRWKKRFDTDRLAGLYARHQGSKRRVLTTPVEARILAWTQKKPSDGTTHWSTRRLAKKLGINHMLIARAWARAGLKPHRMKRYMASNDPAFEEKAADVIGLYINPPQHAAVFCLDEKTAIQALDRLVPVLPLSPGRLERHGFEYFRHGTLSLYAALDVKSGRVLGHPAARSTSEEFVAFLAELVATQSRGRQIHIIADNHSAHKSKRVAQFLADFPNVHLHFTPTYSSWLNQVEIWFSKIERQVIARGVFTSVSDLSRKLMRFIRHYNKDPRPIKWTYTNTARRILPDSVSTVTGN
jgi:transposase